MPLTKDFLAQHKAELGRRLAQLRQQRAQLDADLWGTEGAIRNCDFLLQELAKPEPATTPAAATSGNPPPKKKRSPKP